MKRFSITATQSKRADVLRIKRLPADRHLRLLRVISGVRRGYKGHQNCIRVLAIPFLALSEIHLETVEAPEVPCGTGKGHPYFFVNSPDIAVILEALPIDRAD